MSAVAVVAATVRDVSKVVAPIIFRSSFKFGNNHYFTVVVVVVVLVESCYYYFIIVVYHRWLSQIGQLLNSDCFHMRTRATHTNQKAIYKKEMFAVVVVTLIVKSTIYDLCSRLRLSWFQFHQQQKKKTNGQVLLDISYACLKHKLLFLIQINLTLTIVAKICVVFCCFSCSKSPMTNQF